MGKLTPPSSSLQKTAFQLTRRPRTNSTVDKVLKMSLAKVKRIEDPESFLRRSVLINNTIKRLQREVREEKMMRHGGYTPRLSSCSSYRKSFACSRLSDLSVVDEPVLDDEPGLLEPEGPSPLDSITIDKSHHNSPSIMHNPRKRPLSDEEEEDVQAVLSQIYIPPTPCIISSIDDDDNAMHGVTSSTSGVAGGSSSLSSNPCDSSSALDTVTFTNCTGLQPASSLDCSLSSMSSMLISSTPSSSSLITSSTPGSSTSSSDYTPQTKRARVSDSEEDDDDDKDPTSSLLTVVTDDCLEDDDVDVDVVGDSEISDWPTPPPTPTSLSLLTSAAAAAAVASSTGGMSPLASLALSYSISCASLAGSHHPIMTMSPISAAAAAAAAAMHATSSCLLASQVHCKPMDVDNELVEVVGSTEENDNDRDNNTGATSTSPDDSSNGSSNSSNNSTEDDDDFPTVTTTSWGNENNTVIPSQLPAFSITSSPAFPIFSSSYTSTNPVLSSSTLGNGLMMSPLPCSIPTFVTSSISFPCTTGDDDEDEEDDEEDNPVVDYSSQTKDTTTSSCDDPTPASLPPNADPQSNEDVQASEDPMPSSFESSGPTSIIPSPPVSSDASPEDTTSDTEGSADINSGGGDNNSISPSSSSASSPPSPDAEKQAQQQYSSCGHSSIFGELQSVVFHSLIASLES